MNKVYHIFAITVQHWELVQKHMMLNNQILNRCKTYYNGQFMEIQNYIGVFCCIMHLMAASFREHKCKMCIFPNRIYLFPVHAALLVRTMLYLKKSRFVYKRFNFE